MAKQWSASKHTKLGGMRTDLPPTAMRQEDAVLAKNARIRDGFVERRKGGEKFNATAYGAKITGIHDFIYSGGQDLLIGASTKLWTDDGTTQTEIKTGLTADAIFSFATFDDFAWIVNGEDTPMKWDGTSVTNASIDAPTTHPSISGQTTGGNLDDGAIYKFLVTFFNNTTGQESNPYDLATAVTVDLTPGNTAITALTSIPVSTDTDNVTWRRIYRTTGGDSEYNAKLVYELQNNTTTAINSTGGADIFTDGTVLALLNKSDDDLLDLVPLNHDPIPILTKIVMHKNRAFGFKKNSSDLYYSVENNVWYWPQGITDISSSADIFVEPIGQGDGDVITNLVSYQDFLFIFKKNSMYILTGYDQSDFALRKFEYEINVGCVGKNAACVANNLVYFIDKNGVYTTNGQGIKNQKAVESFFVASTPATDEKVDFNHIDDAFIQVDKKKPNSLVRFALTTSAGSNNDLTLIYNFDNDTWSYDTGYFTTFLATRQVDNEDFLIRGDDLGYVWVEEQQYGDGSVAYSTATSGTTTQINDTTQSFTTNLYTGCYVDILEGTGAGNRYRIASNTATQITIDGTAGTAFDDTTVYSIGAIDFWYVHRWDDYGNSTLTKRLKYIRMYSEGSATLGVNMFVWFDFYKSTVFIREVSVENVALYDVAKYDEDLWFGMTLDINFRTPPSKIHRYSAFGISLLASGQNVVLYAYDKCYQIKGYGER